MNYPLVLTDGEKIIVEVTAPGAAVGDVLVVPLTTKSLKIQILR